MSEEIGDFYEFRGSYYRGQEDIKKAPVKMTLEELTALRDRINATIDRGVN